MLDAGLTEDRRHQPAAQDAFDALAATARATCEDLAARMQPARPNDPSQPPLPTFGDSPSSTDPIPPPVAPPR